MSQQSDVTIEHQSTEPEQQQNRSSILRGLGLIWKVLVGLAVLASFGVWVYAYSGAAARDTDRFEDTELSRAAETICQDAITKTDALPDALDAKNEVERAAQLRQTSAILTKMVDDISQLTTSGERDTIIMGLWIDNWRSLLTDRAEYTERLASDPNARFYMTDTGEGGRPDKRITHLANRNSMPSCIAPQDVG